MINSPTHKTISRKGPFSNTAHRSLRTHQSKPRKIANRRSDQIANIFIPDIRFQNVVRLDAKNAGAAPYEIIPRWLPLKAEFHGVGIGVVLDTLTVGNVGRATGRVVDKGAWAAVVEAFVELELLGARGIGGEGSNVVGDFAVENFVDGAGCVAVVGLVVGTDI
jgi:hypothetical protein